MVFKQMNILQCFLAICVILISQKSISVWSQNLAPMFLSNMTVVRMSEDAARGTSVFRITAEDKDDDPLLYGSEGELASIYFTVDTTNGDVHVKEAIDREVFANSDDHFGITITVADGINALVKKTLHIYIEDVNDNAPVFKGLPYQANIAENENAGMEIFKVFASDPDRGSNGSVTYHILQLIPSDDAELFEISKNGSIFLKGQLDYARASIYQLVIKAMDQGKPDAKYAATRLIINVIDIPNRPPEYLSPAYYVRIPENLPANSVILTVTAVDGDRGINNPITYNINGSGAFAVDNTTGKVTNIALLDREDMEELITIDITACEVVEGIKDLSAARTTTVTILILDVNDNRPTFYSMLGVATDLFQASVPEEPANGMPILHIHAQDLDQGKNGTFGVFLQGPDSAAFNLNQNIVYNEGTLTVQVTNSKALDFERNNVLQFQLFAVELETRERFSCVAKIRVAITDRNDNWPEFNQDYFLLDVPEDSPKGHSVATITATDADGGRFGEISYRLFGSDSALQVFGVDPLTGVFFVKNQTLLDRETRQRYFVTVQAKDGGGLTANAQVEVSVSDANDHEPVFQRKSYSGFVKENEVKSVVQVQAFDKDRENSPNSEITYTIVDGDLARHFSINGSTGVMSVLTPVDRESMDASLNGVVHLTVQAIDGGTPARSSTVQIAIIVEDVNDNGPVFNQSTYFVAVPEDQRDGCVFGIRAWDRDATESNRLVTYRIEDGARGQFIVSAGAGGRHQTACVGVAPDAMLDYDRGPRRYRLLLAAVNPGFDRTGQATVQVDLVDTNDEPPALTANSLSDVLASENGDLRALVATVRALDPDTDAELHYFVRAALCLGDKGRTLDGSLCKGWFRLMERSGALVYGGPVDRERVQAVLLSIQVVDYNTVHSPNMSEEGHIKIIIADENDNSPVFSGTENKKVIVLEYVTEGLEIAVLEASDRDTGVNGAITFHIVEVTLNVPGAATPVNKTATECFYIQTSLNSKSLWEGSLRIRSHLELASEGCWKIGIVAVDGGTPRNAAHYLLEVYIVNGSSKLQLGFDQLPGNLLLMEKQILSILNAGVPGTRVISSRFLPAIKTGDLKRTSMDVYFIDGSGLVVNPDVIRGEIEKNVSTLSSLIELGLTTVGSLSSQLKADNTAALHRAILILAAANITFIALAVLTPLCIRQRYRRQLKAASAISVAELTSVRMNPMVFDVPGTNMYTAEGSNPIWNSGQLNEATSCTNEDAHFDQKSLNSLDDNAIADEKDEKDYFNVREPSLDKYQGERGIVCPVRAQNSDLETSRGATVLNFLSVALASHEDRKRAEKLKSGEMAQTFNNDRPNATDL